MTKEEELFARRLLDLADMAYQRGVVMYTDFLNLNELNIYHGMERELSFVGQKLSGGYEDAERQILALIPDAPFPVSLSFPIACIRIKAQNARFAQPLTHRDYLGALMHTGIRRECIGDILPLQEEALVMCVEHQAGYICGEITRISHTSVTCEVIPCGQLHFTPKTEHRTGSISSVRLDALCALAFKSPRSTMTDIIRSGEVFVNGRAVSQAGCSLKPGDIVSVRGYGRFRYCGELSRTRKGRLMADTEVFL